jgi:hypothetical protein
MGVKLANAASPGNAIPPKISGGVAYAVAKLQKAGTGTHLTSGDERQPIPRKRPQISCSRLAHNDAGGKYRKPNCQCSAPNPKKLPEVATSSLRAIVEVSPEGPIEAREPPIWMPASGRSTRAEWNLSDHRISAALRCDCDPASYIDQLRRRSGT